MNILLVRAFLLILIALPVTGMHASQALAAKDYVNGKLGKSPLAPVGDSASESGSNSSLAPALPGDFQSTIAAAFTANSGTPTSRDAEKKQTANEAEKGTVHRMLEPSDSCQQAQAANPPSQTVQPAAPAKKAGLTQQAPAMQTVDSRSTPKEQITKLGWLGSLTDNLLYKTYHSYESHFMTHAKAGTLPQVFPTGTDKRTQANKISNELLGKMIKNANKDYTYRYLQFIKATNEFGATIGQEERTNVATHLAARLETLGKVLALLQAPSADRQSPSQSTDHKENGSGRGRTTPPAQQQPQQSTQAAVV